MRIASPGIVSLVALTACGAPRAPEAPAAPADVAHAPPPPPPEVMAAPRASRSIRVSPDGQAVRAELQRRGSDFEACRRQYPDATLGRLTFVIAPDGRASSRVVGGDPALAACVEAILDTMIFAPRIDGSSVQVSYPGP